MDIEEILRIKQESEMLATRALEIVQITANMGSDDIGELIILMEEMEIISARVNELRDVAVTIKEQVEGSNIIPFPSKK